LPTALLRRNFSEKSGVVGTVFYVRYRPGVSNNDGHNLLRMSRALEGLVLPDGTHVDTASRATVFAEMIKSLERDGPLATGVSLPALALAPPRRVARAPQARSDGDSGPGGRAGLSGRRQRAGATV
jgi:hypothetical protein